MFCVLITVNLLLPTPVYYACGLPFPLPPFFFPSLPSSIHFFLSYPHPRICSQILEREEGGERERERNIDRWPPIHALIGDQICNPGMGPDQDLNPHFCCTGGSSNQLSHLARVEYFSFQSNSPYHSMFLSGS